MDNKKALQELYTVRWYMEKKLKADPEVVAHVSNVIDMLTGKPVGEPVKPSAPVAPKTAKVSLGIVVGHTKKAQGAVMASPYKVSEYVYNSEIAELVKKHAPKGFEVDVFFRDVGGVTGAYNAAKAEKCDCIIELHFNAANGKAFGTETLVSTEGADKQFGQIVQDEIEKAFDRENNGKGDRGLKVDPARGGASVNAFKGGANCLVEPFFGDNPAEAKMAMERKEAYAKSLIAGVLKWAEKTGRIAA